MSVLPFKRSATAANSKDIEDGLGNSLPVPYYGSVTYREAEDYSAYLESRRTADGSLNVDARFKADVAVMMLRSRFKIDSGIAREEILTMPDGSPMPEPMLDALYNFFQSERNRHAPDSQLLQVVGEDAKEQAIAYAKEKKAVVASRPDLKIFNTYFVFRTEMDVLLMNLGSELDESTRWEIIESFAPESEAAAAPKSEKPTGPESTGSSDSTSPENSASMPTTLATAP